ncbi:MAG TPA: GFA family protein [Kofleriaceae bacterium]|nr:GFA family protein [Kofleriaceae bacterium]
MSVARYLGACHCGAVRFAVALDLVEGASRCNCAICTKLPSMGAFAKPIAFTLLSDEAALGVYEWGAKASRRYFCKTCGVHCFGRGDLPELGGAFVSVNVHVLEGVDPSRVQVTYWDGRHDPWQAGPHDARWPIRVEAA